MGKNVRIYGVRAELETPRFYQYLIILGHRIIEWSALGCVHRSKFVAKSVVVESYIMYHGSILIQFNW